MSTPIRTFYFIGRNGHRYREQGNSMGDPSTPSCDYQTLEEAKKVAGYYAKSEYPMQVYRCEVFTE